MLVVLVKYNIVPVDYPPTPTICQYFSVSTSLSLVFSSEGSTRYTHMYIRPRTSYKTPYCFFRC